MLDYEPTTSSDGDFHYRIPLNNSHAMRLATWALNGMVFYSDRRVVEWNTFSGSKLSYLGIKTVDGNGRLDKLSDFEHSVRWKDGFKLSDIAEYRGVNGGSKVRGRFTYSPDTATEIRLEFETVVSLTPSQLEAAYEKHGEEWTNEVQLPISHAKDEAIEQYQQRKWEQQQQCEHEHTVEEGYFEFPNAVAYCEDCHAELDESGELAY